jgi:AcrR family transcriptional regulator
MKVEPHYDPKNKNDLTKERLLNEAEALFAQRGYHAVSVREITATARCNLGAVNYHFGNKQNLYLEVFRTRWVTRARRLHEFFRRSLAGQISPSLTTLIGALAQAFLEGPLSDQERQRHYQLMARELSQPTEAFKLVAEEVMKPFLKELADMVRPVIPQGMGEERLMLNLLSIFAIVIHFNFARVAITQITGRDYDAGFKAQLVDHIVKFSLDGLGRTGKEETR